MEAQKVPDWLRAVSFEVLFIHGEATNLLRYADAEAKLARVVASNDVEPELRVLAQELLIEAGHTAEQRMAEIYCQTMPDTFLHNWWGMPGQYIERLGCTLISFDKAALPCLFLLLDNKHPLGYFGSEEPTLSARMQYRVCDLAAYFIASIVGVPYQGSDDPFIRDEFNSKLQKGLAPGQ